MHPVPSPPALAFVPLVQLGTDNIPQIRSTRGHISELHYGSLARKPADLFTLLTDRSAGSGRYRVKPVGLRHDHQASRASEFPAIAHMFDTKPSLSVVNVLLYAQRNSWFNQWMLAVEDGPAEAQRRA